MAGVCYQNVKVVQMYWCVVVVASVSGLEDGRDGRLYRCGGGEGRHLVEEVGQGNGGNNSNYRQAQHGGRVAPILKALAHIGVILLQYSGVTVLIFILLPSTASDHTLLTTNVLEDFSAECILISIISGTFSKIFLSLYYSRVVLIVEWIITIRISFRRALVTLQSSTLLDKHHQ